MDIFDVPGAYLNDDMPEDKFILFKHKKNVRVENGVKVLYLRLLEALYECMESALLWYDIYSKTLKPQGLLINPYDRCIANSTNKDEQCIISWYVDDNKVSHVDKEVNIKVIGTIAEHFGNLTVSRGKKHKFLGMEIYFLAYGNRLYL